MGLETGTFINDLVVTNPLGSDSRSEGDNHLRLLKSTLKNTFPGMAGRAWRVQTKSAGYTLVANDNLTVVVGTAAITLALTAAATLGNGWSALVLADGATVTVDPNGAETINGSATAVLANGEFLLLYCTGSAFYGLRGRRDGTLSDGYKGDITVSGSGTNWQINEGAVTFTELQNIATSRLLGRSTAGSGDVEELTLGNDLSLSGGVLTTTGLTKILQGTAVASTSGTAIDFTGIPSWAKEITVMFRGVSTSGTSTPIIRIGDSGGIANTGYLGSSGYINNLSYASISTQTSGFGINATGAASVTYQGLAVLCLQNSSSNTWAFSASLGRSDANLFTFGGGTKALSGTLDRIRLTTVNGTDSFDAGSVNILVKG